MKRNLPRIPYKLLTMILLIGSMLATTGLSAQPLPELMYFRFNTPGDQPNYASAPVGTSPAPLTGLSIGGSGQFGPALLGTASPPAGSGVLTGWVTSLPSTGWTISLWLNNLPSGSPMAQYLFGDTTASEFRCFVNGVALNGIMIRGGGLNDVLVSNVLPGPSVVHFVYTGTSIKTFLNGSLVTTVAQPSVTVTGTGPFKIGAYGNYQFLPANGLIDEFRMYSRALSDAEVLSTWNIPLLPSPTITGPSSVCVGTDKHTYRTQSGKSNYTWTVSAGGTITAGGTTTSDTVTVQWNTAGNQSVSVNYENAAGTPAPTPTIYPVTVHPLPVPTISPSPLMTESFENGGAVPANWAIETVAPNNTLTFVTATSHPTGYTAYSGSYLVRFNSFENGNGIMRLKSTSPVSTVGSLNTSVSFAWLESSGYASADDRVEVEWSLDGNTWNTAGDFSRYDTLPGWKIRTQLLPLAAGGQQALYIAFKFISEFGNDCYLDLAKVYFNNNTVCTGNTTTYQTEAGMTAYGWTLSSGGTITSGSGTNAITVLWSTPGTKSIGVNYTNTNGCKANVPTYTTTIVNPLPVPIISGPNPICAYDTGIYRTQKNMTAYQWNVSSGGTILGTATDSVVSVTWNTAGSGGTRWLNVTYTNANGCTGTSTAYNVTVNPVPVPIITGPDSICRNSTGTYQTQVGMTGYAWGMSTGGVILTGAGTNTVTVRWDSVGSRSLWVNYTNASGCEALVPTVYPVKVHALPVPTITGPDTVCVVTAGNTYTTEAGMTNYQWVVSSGGSVTAGGTTTSNFVTVTWTTTGNKTVSVSYTNAKGCSPATPTVLSILASPIPSPQLFGPASLCAQTSGNLYSTQTGMTNYTWTVSAGGTITSTIDSSAVYITWNSPGAQSVSVNYTTPAGCTGTAPYTLPVTVNARPAPVVSGPVAACAGLSGYIYTTQAGMTNYAWTVSSGGTIQSGTGTNTVSVKWDSIGAQSISVNYTNASGCSAIPPVSYPVAVHPRPVPTITGPDSVCLNTAGHTYTTEAGMTGYLWTVSPGGVVTAGGTVASNFVTVTWTGLGTKSVTVSYINTNGCTPVSPTTFPVLISPIPAPQLFGPTAACVQSAGHIYSTQQGMASYSWTVSAGGTITSATDTSAILVTWNGVGNQYVVVNYTTPAGCTGILPDTLEVTVNPRPSPTISGPVSVCEATGGHIYTTEPMNTAYQWSLSGGGTIVSGSGTNVITVTWDTAGSRQVMVNYTTFAGCNALTPTSYPVTVKPRPIPVITGPTPVCKGISGNTYTTQSGMLNYIWGVSPGNTVTSGGTTGSNFIKVTWNVIDTQYVSVTYTSPNGCTAQTATSFKVKVNPLPTPTISGPDTICNATSGNLYGTQPGMFGYTWAVSAGGTITSGAGTNAISVTWNQAGAQTVSINYADSNGCMAAAPVVYNVQVLALPVPTITGPASACMASTSNTYTTQPGMTGYQWVVSSGGTVTAGGSDSVNFVTVTWNTVGSESVSVGYTNPSGCTSAPLTVYNVTIHPLPVPTITGETSVCANAGNYAYSTETGMTGYVWTTSPSGQITSGQGTSQVQITWLAAGSQWVGVNYTNGNGCSAATASTLTVTAAGPPGQMGPVTGMDTICGATTGVSYSCAPIANANAYNWTVPPGAVITSGAGTTSILVDYPETAATGNVTVTASNACGNGAPSPPLVVTVTQIPTPPVISLNGDMLISNAPAGNQWYLDGALIPGAVGPTYLAQEDGEYWARVIINQCASDTSNHIDVIITGMEDLSGEKITLYPNPNDGTFTIRFNQAQEEWYDIVVVNQLGKKVAEKQVQVRKGNTEHQIDLRPLPIGVYTVLISGDTKRVMRKIIVK